MRSPARRRGRGRSPLTGGAGRSSRESRLATRSLLVVPAVLLAAVLSAPRLASAIGPRPEFRERVLPVLRQHCVRCHQGPKPKGKLDLTSAKGLAAGAEGTPIVVPGKPQDSRLLEVVSGAKPEMPKNGKPLSAAEIAVLRDWIAAGADWPASVVIKEDPLDWWSLRSMIKPRLPTSADTSTQRAGTLSRGRSAHADSPALVRLARLAARDRRG
jgi:mono/diheme cytochrome c family protein